MEKQVEAALLPMDARMIPRVHWLICDNGMTIAEGIAQWNTQACTCVWEDFRPPAEYEGTVRSAVARASARN